MRVGRSASLLPYALGNIGGVVAYFPLLTLLLPLKVAGIAGEARIGVLAAAAVAGSIAAGGSNILFGWLGDRSVVRGKGRRGWLAGGAIATAASLGGVALATSAALVIAAVVLFQVAVNAMLAQIAALIADEVPDERKGFAAGLLALGPPAGAGVSALLVVGVAGEAARLAAVAAIVAACVLPMAIARAAPLAVATPVRAGRRGRRDLAIAWGARLLMQVAGCGIQLYLLYYFQALAAGDAAAGVATLLVIATLLPGLLAPIAGRWSDRTGRRTAILAAAALLGVVGLLTMAVARAWPVGAAGFVLFSVGYGVFVALNLGLAMQMLPNPARRGRDLGLMNLANTLPSTIGPVLAWALAEAGHFGGALLALALLTGAAGGMSLLVREER